MKDINEIHYSVLKNESISSLNLNAGLTCADATVNRAGHAREIAKVIGPTGTLVIFDLDKQALEYSRQRLENLENGPRIIAIHSNYSDVKAKLIENGIEKVDRIFADLGLSSQELEVSGRGFSFLKDEPLHMTFQSEINDGTFTAKDLVNNLSAENLTKIFQVYGDEPKAWKIANAIVQARESEPITTTKQLTEIIEGVSPRKGKTHPATKVFQAIRIAVNDEYEGIKKFVQDGYEMLTPGGIFSIITFHSGEDRIVKNMFKEFGKQEKIKPSRQEVLENKRSRSAILRTIIKK